MTQRLDEFEGPESGYIRYLEQTVSSLRRQLHEIRSATNSNAVTECYSALSTSSQIQFPADDQPANDTNSLQVIQFHPDNERRKRQRTIPPPWVQNAQSLVRDTPEAGRWLQALKEKGIFEFLANGQVLSYLLNTSIADGTIVMHAPSSYEAGDLVSCARNYAQATAKRSSFACVALTLANFQKFLVLSTCAVLLEEGSPITEVLDVVRICMGNDLSDPYCKRILRTAQFVNELIDTLHMNGWGYRASELLLLWNRAPAYYFPLSCSVKTSLDYMKVELCRPGLTRLQEEGGWTPIFVPSLVNQILGQQISIARISHTLGYKNSHLLKIRKNGWR